MVDNTVRPPVTEVDSIYTAVSADSLCDLELLRAILPAGLILVRILAPKN
jgi:hypothetical protein